MARPNRSAGPEGRVTRTALGRADILHVPEHLKKPGYAYRWFNSGGRDESRIQRALGAGYNVCENMRLDNTDLSQTTPMGSVVSKAVGGGMSGILMEIPLEYYKEDQEAKETDIKQKLQGLFSDQNGESVEKSNLYYGDGIKVKSGRPMIQEE